MVPHRQRLLLPPAAVNGCCCSCRCLLVLLPATGGLPRPCLPGAPPANPAPVLPTRPPPPPAPLRPRQSRGLKLNPVTTLYFVAPCCFCFLLVRMSLRCGGDARAAAVAIGASRQPAASRGGPWRLLARSAFASRHGWSWHLRRTPCWSGRRARLAPSANGQVPIRCCSPPPPHLRRSPFCSWRQARLRRTLM